MGARNSHTDFYVGLLRATVCDVSAALGEPFDSKNLARDVSTLEARFASEGIGFVTKVLPRLGKHFDHALEVLQFAAFEGFKAQKGRTTPRFLSALFNRVFDSSGALREDADPNAVRGIRQVCFCLYKLELPFEPFASAAVLGQFVLVEEELKLQVIRSDDELVTTASHIAETIFDGFDPKDISPRQGPGSVATGERFDNKWEFSRLYRTIHQVYPYYEYFIVGGGREVLDRVQWYRNLARLESGEAKVLLVPKDSRGPRLISAEPLEFQYIQQGLGRELVSFLERSNLTRGHINFSDQTINQKLALESSRTKAFATIDLKDASDRVSTLLVSRIFERCPELLRALLAVRTSATRLPNGDLVQLSKFAPMGSSVCFPVLASVCYVVIASALVRKYHLPLGQAVSGIYVYGDDIIVRNEWYHDVVEALSSVGLVVNTGKSYTYGPFRESCGWDAFNGHLVQPLRWKKLYTGNKFDGQLLAALVSFGNQAKARGYVHLHQFIKERTEKLYGLIPHGLSTSPMPCWEEPSYWRAICANRATGIPARWNKKYHLLEFNVLRLQPGKRRSTLDGWQRLLREQLQPSLDPSSLGIRRSLKIKRRWTSI